MVDFSFVRFGLKFRQIMFLPENGAVPAGNEDVCLFYRGNDDCQGKNAILYGNKGVYVTHQITLENDLTVGEEELFAGIKKNCKYEIRRAEREGVHTAFFTDLQEIEDRKILTSLQSTYNKMFSNKGRRNRFNRPYVEAALKAGSLLIGAAYLGEAEEPVVYHVTVLAGKYALLMYSTSILWNEGEVNGKLIGWANKRLHWDELSFCKNKGVAVYDWGGIQSAEMPNGIDRFKMEFSGAVKQYDNMIIARTLKGAAYVAALRAMEKL